MKFAFTRVPVAGALTPPVFCAPGRSPHALAGGSYLSP